MKNIYTILFILLISCISCISQNIISITEYEDLFDTIQKSNIFSDQKMFVDFTPKQEQSPSQILSKYHKEKNSSDFDLLSFVSENFDTVFIDTSYILKHINYLWQYLTRVPEDVQDNSTLIPLKYPYIIPGGRFREIYYWDSYFTMLGLEEAEETEMIKNMLDNFAYLIKEFGHIPNGNRSYYLSRSQPPFFSLMIELYADLPQTNKAQVYTEYRDVLATEYDFWMKHNSRLTKVNKAEYRVVRLYKDCLLNRYYDDLSTPRPESYLNDLEIKVESSRNESIYREIRAAAESGWDFSSRWFRDERTLTTIQTTSIIPIDLNCLLYHMELVLSKMYNVEKSKLYKNAAEKRKESIINAFWDEDSNFFFDYNFTKGSRTQTYSLAALYPLFFNIVDAEMAQKVTDIIEQDFLKAGGLVTTLNCTGQQWDYPNGWAPLQWIAYVALKNYGYNSLANDIAKRWINLNSKVFFETNKMMEKYDVVDIHRKGGGGEYKLQDGFGWTNSVFLKLWNEMH